MTGAGRPDDAALAVATDGTATDGTAADEAAERTGGSGSAANARGRSLGARTARGASTVLAGQAAKIVIQIGTVSILSRVLDSSDYGLIAIVLAVVGVGEIFRDFGLSTAAIQARNLSTAQRDKLFWVNTGLGVGLGVLCALAAPLVALAFDDPDLTPITRALALTFLLNGTAAQYRASLSRGMRFTPLTVSDVGGQVVGTAIALVLAWRGAGYWALVAQQLSAGGATLLMYAVYAGWLPRVPPRGTDIRPFARFGLGLVGTQVVAYVNSNIDTLAIGLRFPASELGYYNRGYQLLMRPLGQLRTPTTSVALPVLSRLQDDRARTDRFVVQGQLALGYTLVALTAFAAGAAEPVVSVFLGGGWDPVVPVFSLLAVAGGLQTIAYVGNWVYISRALTGQLFRYSLVSLAIKVVCVLVGSIWGVVGVAGGFALAYAFEWPLSLWWLSRLTPMPVRDLYLGAARIVSSAVVAGGAAFLTVRATASSPDILRLVLAAVAVLAAYGALAALVPHVRRDVRSVVEVAREAVRR